MSPSFCSSILLYTGSGKNPHNFFEQISAVGLGADDYLTKLYQLEGLLDDSFLCTRLLGASLPMKCASVAALPLLWEALAEFYPQFETAGAAPELQFGREDMTVRGNAEVLGWVYRNLIANALRHGGGGLTVNAGDGAVNFSPLGPCPTSDPEHLFNRFCQSSPARGQGRAGLGLSIVRELMG